MKRSVRRRADKAAAAVLILLLAALTGCRQPGAASALPAESGGEAAEGTISVLPVENSGKLSEGTTSADRTEETMSAGQPEEAESAGSETGSGQPGTSGGSAREDAYVSPIDFDSLLAENPDVVGWIRIEDTNIDYPILQTKDNDYYLYRDFYGNDSTAGSIYLDYESKGDFQCRHNIIYGHRMRNGSMFRDVIKFRDQKFFEDHPYFTIYTPDREIRLKVVSCYYDENSYELRRTRFAGQSFFEQYVDRELSGCAYAEEVEQPARSLFTLITCSYEVDDARTMLTAVEVDENGEQIEADQAFMEKADRDETMSERRVLRQLQKQMPGAEIQ